MPPFPLITVGQKSSKGPDKKQRKGLFRLTSNLDLVLKGEMIFLMSTHSLELLLLVGH